MARSRTFSHVSLRQHGGLVFTTSLWSFVLMEFLAGEVAGAAVVLPCDNRHPHIKREPR